MHTCKCMDILYLRPSSKPARYEVNTAYLQNLLLISNPSVLKFYCAAMKDFLLAKWTHGLQLKDIDKALSVHLPLVISILFNMHSFGTSLWILIRYIPVTMFFVAMLLASWSSKTVAFLNDCTYSAAKKCLSYHWGGQTSNIPIDMTSMGRAWIFAFYLGSVSYPYHMLSFAVSITLCYCLNLHFTHTTYFWLVSA